MSSGQHSKKGTCYTIPTAEIWRTSARGYEDKCGFPHCIGAPHGKHVSIQAPANSGPFFNYKGTFSVVLLSLVYTDYRFLVVNVGGCSSNSDRGIFANSCLGQALQAGHLNVLPLCPLPTDPELGPLPFMIVVDETFPMKTYLLHQYPGRCLHDDIWIFNYRLSRARHIVENFIVRIRFKNNDFLQNFSLYQYCQLNV